MYGKHTIGYTRLLEARQAAFINYITMFHPNHQPPLSPCPFVDSLQFIHIRRKFKQIISVHFP